MKFNLKRWLFVSIAAVWMPPFFGTAAQADEACIPVMGIVSSRFGPRYHPILRESRQHYGVDWIVPERTPVVAAMAGTYTRIDDANGYGKIVHLDHAGSLQTRYRQLGNFVETAKLGDAVKAGDVIGYTGVSTHVGPPVLHFELRLVGEPINPFGDLQVSDPTDFEVVADDLLAAIGGRMSGPHGASIGSITDRTWVRLIREYRPDSHDNMSREDVLALRAGSVLHREMIVNLLKENASFLTDRGHHAGAGQLHLAHLLGPEETHKILSADSDATVAEILGDSVVRFNPFLADYTAVNLVDWANFEMRRVNLGINPIATIPVTGQTISWADNCGQ